MVKLLFFFMELPMIIMSFFQVTDALPYVANTNLIVDEHQIVLSVDQQKNLEEQVKALFNVSHTMPAFGVVFGDMFQEEMQSGYFVSLKFNGIYQINGLNFDELIFKVVSEHQGFNLVRGQNGVYEGRCIYIDLQEKNMSALYDLIDTLPKENLTDMQTNKTEKNTVENVSKNEIEMTFE